MLLRNIAAVVVLSSLSFAQASPPNPEKIAFRYDDTHVVVVLDQTGGDVHDNPADQLTPLPPAHTRYSGLDEIGTSDELVTRFISLFGSAHAGQVWAIEGDAQHLFAGELEKFAFASADCATAIDALALLRVSPEQQSEFQKFSGDYFLAVNSESGKAPQSSGIGFVPGEVKLSAAQTKQLKIALDAALQQRLKSIKTASNKPPSAQPAEHEDQPADRWTAADARLARGEGKLTWEVQQLKVGPQGEERLYIRAKWSLGDYAAFVMTAWVLPDTLRLEAVDGRNAVWLRSGELRDKPPEDATVGQILAVFAGENGWARVLVGAAAEEGYEMEVLQLSPAGPKQTDIAYGYGC